MAKVKVKVNKTFSSREVRRFDTQLVEKYPILREGTTVMMEEDAVRFLQTTIDPNIVEKEGNVKESDTRSTKDGDGDDATRTSKQIDPMYNKTEDSPQKKSTSSKKDNND